MKVRSIQSWSKGGIDSRALRIVCWWLHVKPSGAKSAAHEGRHFIIDEHAEEARP
jgi:hypothetical protein